MIALDTSTLVAYLAGEGGEDVEAAETALAQEQAVLPPVVLSELLSDPKLPAPIGLLLGGLPVLGLHEGYWERTGRLRAKVKAAGRRAPLAGALIAQSCLDHGVPLVTRDTDFRHFVRAGGLALLSGP